jgi:hypothetical protein
MRTAVSVVAALLVVVLPAVVTVTAQEGHPLAGTWYGDYTVGAQKRDLTIILTWDGKAASGTINPGPDAIPLTSVALTITPGKPAAEGQNSTTGVPPVFNVRFQASLPGGATTFEGTILNPVAGNRRITGTWTTASDKGVFAIRRL